ncbi:MAG: hypothetical protein AB7G11_11560 [Phycisphaerales bacterium]
MQKWRRYATWMCAAGAVWCGSQEARAVGIANGDFEAAATAPWRGAGRARVIVRMMADAQYGFKSGFMDGMGVSLISQTFDCEPVPPNPEGWCTVTFDSNWVRGNANNDAFVVLENAGGVVVGLIPPGAGRHTLSISGCLDPTRVTFILDNNTMAFGSLLIDNVVCACAPADMSDIPRGSQGDLPQDLPPEGELPQNGPDVPAISVPGLVGMGVVMLVVGGLVLRRFTASAA